MNISNKIRTMINLNLASFSRRTIVTYGFKIRSSSSSSSISPILVKATDFNKNVFLNPEGPCGFPFENVSSPMTKRIPALLMQDSLVRTQISDPKISEKLNIGVPLNGLLIKDFKLPSLKENNAVEPVGNVMKKEALNIFQIRRRKMRKHKRKKIRRKMRVFFINKKNKKRAKQNKELMAFVTQALEEGEKYNMDAHVNDVLEKLKWEPPVTRVRGRLAPEWVIKEYSEKERLKTLLKKRIKYCFDKL